MPVLPQPDAVPPGPGPYPTVAACSSWATLEDACSPCTDDSTELEKWIAVASDLLYELSGQRFPGVCEDIVHPCAQCHGGDAPRFYGDPVLMGTSGDRSWFGSCGCTSACGCTSFSTLTLNGWPLLSVTEVVIDGVTLDEDAYEINDWKTLVRVDGESWPACSDDFEITYNYGALPPPAGAAAAAALGCQLALACSGGDGCRLPQRVQSITRQGVSMVLLDPFTFFEEGRTGLYDVDLFLAAYGPTAKKRWGALIVNPDMRAKTRRVTG